MRYFWVKPSDVSIYVERGAADVGIAGKDILLEYRPDVYELLDLKMGKCRMCVAGPEDFYDDPNKTLRVATKFPTSPGTTTSPALGTSTSSSSTAPSSWPPSWACPT